MARQRDTITTGVLGLIDDPLLRSFLTNIGTSNTFQTQNRSGIKFPIDIINEEKTIYIYAEMPGALKETIYVDFFNNNLTITADKNKTYDAIPETSELKYGKYDRSITLPICITKKEAVSISFKDGILKLKINKLVEEENKFSVRLE
jgi:HSP20 family protein